MGAGAGAKVASNVRKRHIGDGGIENLHEGRQGDRRRDEPWIDLRLPLRATFDLFCHPMPFFDLVNLRRIMQSPPSIPIFTHYIKDIMYLKAYRICIDVSTEEEAQWLPETQTVR
jgi:hypothetical protein